MKHSVAIVSADRDFLSPFLFSNYFFLSACHNFSIFVHISLLFSRLSIIVAFSIPSRTSFPCSLIKSAIISALVLKCASKTFLSQVFWRFSLTNTVHSYSSSPVLQMHLQPICIKHTSHFSCPLHLSRLPMRFNSRRSVSHFFYSPKNWLWYPRRVHQPLQSPHECPNVCPSRNCVKMFVRRGIYESYTFKPPRILTQVILTMEFNRKQSSFIIVFENTMFHSFNFFTDFLGNHDSLNIILLFQGLRYILISGSLYELLTSVNLPFLHIQ